MHKKPLFLVTFLTFLFLFCSGCVKNVEKCKIFPKIELESGEKNESSDKKVDTKDKIKNVIDNRTTYAHMSCKF